jgi:hypothetical protein
LVDAELGFLLFRSMAIDAMLLEDRLDVSMKIHGAVGG